METLGHGLGIDLNEVVGASYSKAPARWWLPWGAKVTALNFFCAGREIRLRGEVADKMIVQLRNCNSASRARSLERQNPSPLDANQALRRSVADAKRKTQA